MYDNALSWFAARTDPLIAMHELWDAPDWNVGSASMSDLFGLGRSAHFLKQPRGVLPQLWERQITQGMRALLLDTPGRTLERCQSLFEALLGSNAPRLASVDRVTADDNTRIDLAVFAHTDAGAKCCLILEAKLQANLSVSQLPTYKAEAKRSHPKPEQRHLWVVAPERTAAISKVLARRGNGDWQFVTWRRLLLNWQRALPEDPGADVLSLFGEIWKRAGGQ